ncbi:MAG: Ig-like domain-containing protein [Gemmatimonadales bacterium]
MLGGLAVLAACAKFGPPPGGPPDAIAPVLVATRPDSLGTFPDFRGDAEFIFDETISEGGSPNFGYGTGDLERMVVLSPSDEVPRVKWERSRIAVHPREGWRPNTVYRIELLPGITDLRRNRSRSGQIITFSTGAPLPTDSLSGIVIDWTTRQPARLAAIEALLLPDSLVYRTQSDSTGRFILAPIPHGAYLLRGFLDQNRDRRINGKENWDSVGVAPAPAATAVLWLAPHDTLAPRVMQVTWRDSLTVEIQLTQPIDPYQVLDTSNIVVLQLPDSVPMVARTFRTKPLDDSLVARARVEADSLRADSLKRARPDTGQRPGLPGRIVAPPAPAPTPILRRRAGVPIDSTVIKLAQTRPALGDRLVLRLAAPMPPESRYVLEVRGIRNVNGVAGNAAGGFAAPRQPPPPPPKAAADSTRQDSTAVPPRRP